MGHHMHSVSPNVLLPFFKSFLIFFTISSLPLRFHQPDKIYVWDKSKIPDGYNEPPKERIGETDKAKFRFQNQELAFYFVRFWMFWILKDVKSEVVHSDFACFRKRVSNFLKKPQNCKEKMIKNNRRKRSKLFVKRKPLHNKCYFLKTFRKKL